MGVRALDPSPRPKSKTLDMGISDRFQLMCRVYSFLKKDLRGERDSGVTT